MTITRAALGLAALCAGSLAASAGQATLDASAIQALFPGHYEASVAGGYILLISAHGDGSLDGRAFGREDKGRWEIAGDRLCVSWSQWTKGKPKCGDIAQVGSWFTATNAEDGEMLRFRATTPEAILQKTAQATRTRD